VLGRLRELVDAELPGVARMRAVAALKAQDGARISVPPSSRTASRSAASSAEMETWSVISG
jgi:hypothetical protein